MESAKKSSQHSIIHSPNSLDTKFRPGGAQPVGRNVHATAIN